MRELEHVLVHDDESERVPVVGTGIAGKGTHTRHAARLGNDASTHGLVAHAPFRVPSVPLRGKASVYCNLPEFPPPDLLFDTNSFSY